MDQDNHYIIEGGAAGKKRLQVLAGVLEAYTKELLLSEGTIAGKSFLDAGSGGGHVATMAAGLVGPQGKVTAVDFDEEIIDLASQDAAAMQLANISYRTLNAYDLDYAGAFDIAYARFLLSHLQDPALVLAKLRDSLKPNGRLIIEDIDFSGHFCYPAHQAFDDYLHYFVTAARNNGHNAHIGLSLFELFTAAGIRDIRFDVIQPYFSKGQGKWMAYYTMDRIKTTVVKQALATEQEIENTLEALKTFTQEETTIISLPRIFRVWGRRP
jgi:ubiquinone/menaquinone biosynthesis C-methylase UbiE